MQLRSLGIAVLCLGLLACGPSNNGTNNGNGSTNNGNNGGKGDCAGDDCSWADENLVDRSDPIANFLRDTEEAASEGVIEGDYQSIQFALADGQGCDRTTASNYIISDELFCPASDPNCGAFPRLVSTVCSDDENKNWQVFMSPPEVGSDGDLDVEVIEMFAWDAEEKMYRFYATSPAEEEGTLRVEVEPSRCAECHLGPRGLDVSHMPMVPVMNELTQPWQHWNAEPGFDSTEFEVPESVEDKPHYSELTNGTWKSSASKLEQTIRRGHLKVAEQRVFERREKPADVSLVMAMLRPLFCDEQVNYVTEAGTSGQIALDAIVGLGLRELVRKKEPSGWGQKWMDPEASLRMPEPDSAADKIKMFPVRGAFNKIYENQLASLGGTGISHDRAIQIRLIDWQTPAMSDARCKLWVDTNERLKREDLETELDLEEERNYKLIPVLVEEIMQVDGVSLLTGNDGEYYMLADGADLQTLVDAIESDDVSPASCDQGGCTCEEGACVADLETMVDVIDEYVVGFEDDPQVRENLRTIWEDRVCEARACYNNQPDLPEIEGCSQSCPIELGFSGQ